MVASSAWQDRTGAPISRREKDLDFLTEVRSAKSQGAHLWNHEVSPKRDRQRSQRAREPRSAARVACRNRGCNAEQGGACQKGRCSNRTPLSHFTNLLIPGRCDRIVRWAWRENNRARAMRTGCSCVRPSAMTARIDEAVAKRRTFAT